MNNQSLLSHITFDPKVLSGKPIIRGLRISVSMILELLAKGALLSTTATKDFIERANNSQKNV